MYSNTAVRASALVGQERRWMRSFFRLAWKLSIAALSKQSPRDPLDTSIPTRPQRLVMCSPGRPPGWRREHRVRFWAAIARGVASEEAAVEAGVSAAVGVRGFG